MIFLNKIIIITTGYLLLVNTLFAFDKQDTLRGSNGNGRNWWDVKHYKLKIQIDTANKLIIGSNEMHIKTLAKVKDSMQIDLQYPMMIDSVILANKHLVSNTSFRLKFIRERNIYWVKGLKPILKPNSYYNIKIYYNGKAHIANNPPWNGGLIYTQDSLGNPWISVACQGIGASLWWPCKDYQEDEPDSGAHITISIKDFPYTIIANGRKDNQKNKSENSYIIKNPINTYNISFYAGNYSFIKDTFQGLKGILDIECGALYFNRDKMKLKVIEVKKMLRAFEFWLGPYPFYEDSYKLIEAPFLGMEHQSNIAYGNKYLMGYLGKDRSHTGIGLLFDFIIVHESGHEWFGNSITASDIADNWIHEGFTTYLEALYVDYYYGKEQAIKYTIGEWSNIKNDRPVIGYYGVNDAGSSDKYDKGAALIHTIRVMINNDYNFRQLLHKINNTFYHKQISSENMETFICQNTKMDFSPIFNQYLRTKNIPELQFNKNRNTLKYRWNNTVKNFSLPIYIQTKDSKIYLKATDNWQTINLNQSHDTLTILPQLLYTVKYINY